MRKHSIPFAALILVLSTGLLHCAGEDGESATSTADGEAVTRTVEPPTKEEAARIIQKAPDYSDHRFTSVTLSIPMKEERMHEQMKSYVRDLERAGWLRLDSTGTVVLSDKARRDNRWVERPNGFTDIAPLARKEFGEIISVEKVDEDTVNVDFSYLWIPNAAGAAIQSGLLYDTLHSDHYATATLEHYSDGWELFIIRPADPPAEASTGNAEEADESNAE